MCYRCIFILDTSAPAFGLDVPLYRQQLNKDLVMNVYSNGQWGSYRHLPLDSCDTIPVPHAYVNVTTRGDLSSLKWIEGKLQLDRYAPNTEVGSAYMSIYLNII
jgi:fatty acid synthase